MSAAPSINEILDGLYVFATIYAWRLLFQTVPLELDHLRVHKGKLVVAPGVGVINPKVVVA
jgi:hypothetical protein